MAEKCFTVTFKMFAESKDQIEKWLDQTRMPMKMAEAIYDEVIKGDDEKHYEERIRFVEDWGGEGEHYLFEGKWSDEQEWGLDQACKLLDYGKEKNAVISYQALTKIRELMRMGIDFRFS